jgi:X-X-X-Leu-X-X-Gly heptad repeat protein
VVGVLAAACTSPIADRAPQATLDDRAMATTVSQLATKVDQLSSRVEQLSSGPAAGLPRAEQTSHAETVGGLTAPTGITAEFATAQAQATTEADYVAWHDRLVVSSVYVSSCSIARQIASSTTSGEAAVATAQALRSARPVVFCPDTPTPVR